jgi:hypothetical protein
MGRRPGFLLGFTLHPQPMASCTRPAALTAITPFNCAEHFGQIVLLLIQRGQSAPSFATEAELQTLAVWTALLTAPGPTKVIKTPEFAGFVIPGSEPQYADENNNNSIDGNGYFTGFNAVKVTGKFVGIPSAIKKQLDLLEDESRPGLNPGTTAFPVTRDGRLIYDMTDAGIIRGLPFVNFFRGGTSSQGLNANNENAFGLTLPDGKWDRNVQIIKPDFNPRTDL